MTDTNIIIIVVAFVVAIIAIYILYSIILYQGNNGKGDDLQLSTKNILDQVEILFDKKEYALVQLLASKYLDRVPNHNDVRLYLAKAYYEDRKYNQAINQCNILLKKSHHNIEATELLGDCYCKKNFYFKAIKEYEIVVDSKKNDVIILRKLAELYRDTDQLYSAIDTYRKLSDNLDKDEEIADVQSILAELNEEARNYPAAFEAYKTRLGIYPTDVTTNSKLVKLYIKIKNYPVAIETLLYMLTFVTDVKVLLWIYETLVELFVESENYEKAIEYSEKLLDIQGSDKFKVRSNIADYNIKLNRLTEGIKILEDLVMLSQNGFDVTTALAAAHLKCKDYQKALDLYLVLLDKSTPKEAKTLNRLICELYIAWAIEYREQELMDESFGCLQEATRYNPLNPEVYFNLSQNYYIGRNYGTSIEEVKKAIEYDKSQDYYAKYMLLLSENFHATNSFFEEKKTLTDLLKFDDKNPEALYRVGLMYVTQHDTKNAEDAFKKAIQYDPNMLDAKYNLALLFEINNRDRAKELYIEIIEQDPTHIEAKNALIDLTTSES